MDGDETNGNECWFISDGNAYTHKFIAPEAYEGMVFGFGDAEWNESAALRFFAGTLRDTAAYGVDASKARSKAEAIAMIESAQGEDAVEDDGEEPPVFGAAMPE